MPRKSRTRAKVVAPPVAAAAMNDPNPEAQRRGVFNVIPAPRQDDEQLGRDKRVYARRRVTALERMEMGDNPWLDRSSAAALERYALLIEQAGYDSA